MQPNQEAGEAARQKAEEWYRQYCIERLGVTNEDTTHWVVSMLLAFADAHTADLTARLTSATRDNELRAEACGKLNDGIHGLKAAVEQARAALERISKTCDAMPDGLRLSNIVRQLSREALAALTEGDVSKILQQTS